MPEQTFDPEVEAAMATAGELRVPLIEEEAHVEKREVGLERVTVRTVAEEHQVVLRDEVRREQVEVTRVAINREVAEAPPVRTEGDVTVVSIVEERLVVEKRLFVVEELHLTKTATAQPVELPATLRRMRADIERHDLHEQEQH
jgi:stress response protein YsnF